MWFINLFWFIRSQKNKYFTYWSWVTGQLFSIETTAWIRIKKNYTFLFKVNCFNCLFFFYHGRLCMYRLLIPTNVPPLNFTSSTYQEKHKRKQILPSASILQQHAHTSYRKASSMHTQINDVLLNQKATDWYAY